MTKPNLLLTRPVSGTEAILSQLSSAAHDAVDIIVSPLLEIVPTETDVDTADYRGVIFTSAQAVALAPSGSGTAAYCVGQRTADAALRHGWQIAMNTPDADAAVAHLVRKGVTGPLLHLAGRYRRGDIAERLSARGCRVDVVTLYNQHLLPLSEAAQTALSNGDVIIVPLFSPRSAAQFAAQAATTRNATVVAMSEAVAQMLDGHPLRRLLIAPEPTGPQMVELLEMLILGTSLP